MGKGMMKSEVWKEIEGTNGMYEVSNTGKVRSLDYRQTGKTKELVCQVDKKGYKRVRISRDGKKYSFKIHRLVANAFIPNPENKPHVNHINGDKSDNRAENLEWMTCQENADHAMKNHLWDGCLSASARTNEKRKKPIVATNIKTGEKITFESMRDAEKALNTKHINAVIRGERKQANGYSFECKRG